MSVAQTPVTGRGASNVLRCGAWLRGCSDPSGAGSHAQRLPSFNYSSLITRQKCRSRPNSFQLNCASDRSDRPKAGPSESPPVTRKKLCFSQVAFRCPVCDAALEYELGEGPRVRALECCSGHNVAVAKEGHVNLLPSGRKSKQRKSRAGDEDGMVRARRAFFEQGHFASVADCLAHTVLEGFQKCSATSDAKQVAVLDAGCGEGMYIGQIQQVLTVGGYACDCLGVDISPLAIKLAARKYGSVRFAVANCFHLPFPDSSFDCIVTAFSPWPVSEFKRVLRPGGFVVAAGPGEQHLIGLKAVLYDTPFAYEPRRFGSSTVGGAVESSHPDRPPDPEVERRVLETLCLSTGDDAKNLLQMTPYWWKAKPEQQLRISQREVLKTPIDVRICRHRYHD